LPRPDAVRLSEFVAIPKPLWQIRQLLFWLLSVQLRSDVQHVCADLPRSDAVRLTDFVAFPMPLWHIRQFLFWLLSVQLRTAVRPSCVDLLRLAAVRLIEFRAFPANLTPSTSSCLESCVCKSNPTFHFSRMTPLHRRWGAKPLPSGLPSWQIANQFLSQGEHYASRNFSQQLEPVRTGAGLSGSGVL
jgi:hypothetical protein